MNTLSTTPQLLIREQDLSRLLVLLVKHLPNITAWAYGSRVNGDAHDASDLDVVLRSPDLTPIDTGKLAEFKDALSESNIPIMVDVRDWARLPKSFHAQIERQYVVLIEPI